MYSVLHLFLVRGSFQYCVILEDITSATQHSSIFNEICITAPPNQGKLLRYLSPRKNTTKCGERERNWHKKPLTKKLQHRVLELLLLLSPFTLNSAINKLTTTFSGQDGCSPRKKGVMSPNWSPSTSTTSSYPCISSLAASALDY